MKKAQKNSNRIIHLWVRWIFLFKCLKLENMCTWDGLDSVLLRYSLSFDELRYAPNLICFAIHSYLFLLLFSYLILVQKYREELNRQMCLILPNTNQIIQFIFFALMSSSRGDIVPLYVRMSVRCSPYFFLSLSNLSIC